MGSDCPASIGPPVRDGIILVDANIHGVGIEHQNAVRHGLRSTLFGFLQAHVKRMRSVEISRVGTYGVVASEDTPQLARSTPQGRVEMLAQSVDRRMRHLGHVGHA